MLFPGTLPGVPAYTVKVHAKFSGQEPAIRGVMCLHDSTSGALLAVMDSMQLTAVRTGTAGALAAHVLARPDARRVAWSAWASKAHQLHALAAGEGLAGVQLELQRVGMRIAVWRWGPA